MEHVYYNDRIGKIPVQLTPLLLKCKQPTLFVYINMKSFNEIARFLLNLTMIKWNSEALDCKVYDNDD